MKLKSIVLMGLILTLIGSNYSPPISTIADVNASGSLKNILLIGDSTIAAHQCRSQSIADIFFSASEKSNGFSASTIAVPGHTIQNQLTTWNAYANKTIPDVIIIEVGLNNCNSTSNTVASNRTNYQNLINAVNAGKKSEAITVISAMTPARQRWYDVYADGAASQALWVQLNYDIMNYFTGVDKRNNLHVSLLSDSSGNLAPAYDCGDHIHENDNGADIIRKALRKTIY